MSNKDVFCWEANGTILMHFGSNEILLSLNVQLHPNLRAAELVGMIDGDIYDRRTFLKKLEKDWS